MESPGIGVAGAKHDLKVSLDALDGFNFVMVTMIAQKLARIS
jgi:hypothetical protein